MSDTNPGWQPDPTGKHDHRYWDGTQWTENVSDAGVAGIDPYEAAAFAAPDAPAPEEPTSIADGASDPYEAPAPIDPTVVDQPAVAPDATAAWPTTPAAPAPPPPYVATEPVSGGGDSKKALLIGGGILAAVILVVIAVVALGGGDDDDKDFRNASDTTEPTDSTEDGSDTTEGPDGEPEDGSYGSDAELDALYDGCEDGDYADCDQLYLDSPSGSDYEAFGDTCGERNEPSGYCEELYADDGGGDPGGLTDGSDLPENFEEMLADTYESTLDLSRDQAECLAGKLGNAIREGTLTEEEAMSDFFDYLSDCDISMEEIGGN